MRYQRAESPALLDGFDAAHRFFAGCFTEDDRSRERIWAAHVDEAARCIHLECYGGDTSTVELPIRSIMTDAARFGSAGVVLAHNHPSGDPTPSQADYRATRALVRAAETIDLAIIDHLVFAQGAECRSMRRMGFL
jgi:DNA repair protein RadC